MIIPSKLDSKKEAHLPFGSINSLTAATISKIWSKFLSRVSYKNKRPNSNQEAAKWTMGGAYFCFFYVCSLRGEEGFLLDIKKLREHWSRVGGNFAAPLRYGQR